MLLIPDIGISNTFDPIIPGTCSNLRAPFVLTRHSSSSLARWRPKRQTMRHHDPTSEPSSPVHPGSARNSSSGFAPSPRNSFNDVRKRSKKSRKSADDTRDHFGERSRGKQRRRTPQKKGVQWSAIELIRRWSGAKDRAEYEKRRISSFEVEREGKRWCSDSHTVPMQKSSAIRLVVLTLLGLFIIMSCVNALMHADDWFTHLAMAWATVIMMALIDRYADL